MSPADHPLRLLVISYHFPPDGAVGALRWGGITKYLARGGWEIEVVTSGGIARPDAVDGVRVHSVPRLKTLNDVYQALRPSTREPVSSESTTSQPEPRDSGIQGRMRRLRRGAAAVMGYPSYARGWLFRAAHRARRIIKAKDIELVVTSGPPHIAHTVGLLATLGTGAKWTIDLRDPWGGRNTSGTPAFLKQLTLWLKRESFERCDQVVANTPQFAALLRENYPDTEIHWIPNGIDLEGLPQRLEPPLGPITIAYAGTLYLKRDLAPILEGMQRVISRSNGGGRLLKLRFVGHASAERLAELRRQMRRLNLTAEQVEILGSVSRAEAREIVRRAHLAVVLAQQQPLQVPAKLYELVGMRVPTLVVAEADSASASEAERVGALWSDPGDTERIAEVIEGVATGALASLPAPIEHFDYENIAAKIADVLPRSV